MKENSPKEIKLECLLIKKVGRVVVLIDLVVELLAYEIFIYYYVKINLLS